MTDATYKALTQRAEDLAIDINRATDVAILVVAMLAALKEQAEELRLERNFASDRDEEMKEVYAENTRLRAALKKLINKVYGRVELDAAITDAMEALEPK